jgi:uncharacterized metal-binding protein
MSPCDSCEREAIGWSSGTQTYKEIHTMKKLMTIMLGLSLLSGAIVLADDAKTDKKETKKKAKKGGKKDEKKTT